jgi:hypothetical protein
MDANRPLHRHHAPPPPPVPPRDAARERRLRRTAKRLGLVLSRERSWPADEVESAWSGPWAVRDPARNSPIVHAGYGHALEGFGIAGMELVLADCEAAAARRGA